MMHMWFWVGDNLGTFLFPGYNVTTTWSLVCTCLGLAALTILYEGMKVFAIKLQQVNRGDRQRIVARSSENSLLLSRMVRKPLQNSAFASCSNCTIWTIQVLHWSTHTVLGYLLMMAVMTYNAYISIALVFGSGVGYFIFGPKLIELNMQQFHRKEQLLECNRECSDNIISHESQGSAISLVAEQLVTEATVQVQPPNDA